MRKFILFSFLIVLALNSFGQKHGKKDAYAYGGVSLSGSSTWLMNKFVYDKGDIQDIAMTFGSGFGLVAGYIFNKNIGVEMNILFNGHNQKYTGVLNTNPDVTYKSKTHLRYIDIPLLFKAGNETYFEIGPDFSFLTKAEHSITVSTPTESTDSTRNVKSKFNGSSFNLVFGFGHYFEINKQLMINAGFRLMYGLSDIKGVDGIGWSKSDYATNEKGIADFKTNLAAGYIHVGVIYKIQ